MKWKWTIPILALLAFLATTDANAQLFRRHCARSNGGSGTFSFQDYVHMRIVSEILHNRTRIENLEAQLLQSRIDALRTEINENAEQIIAQRAQDYIQGQVQAQAVHPVPPGYVPVYRQPASVQVQVRTVPRVRYVRRQ